MMTRPPQTVARETKLGAALGLVALVVVACDSGREATARDDTGSDGGRDAGHLVASNDGGIHGAPWNFGEPLLSDRGQFSIANHDRRLLVGTWEALRVEDNSGKLRVPFTLEFSNAEGVSVETVEGEPHHFHATKAGTAVVHFRATDGKTTLQDSFRFEVEESVSMAISACDQVLGGSGTDVGFQLNGRFGAAPQGLLPVQVSPSSAGMIDMVDGYLATRFQLHVTRGFMGTVELRSTLPDRSTKTLRAVDPLELEPPRILGQGSVGVGTKFTVMAEARTAGGVVCSPVPVILEETEASDCRVLRRIQTSFYEPFEPPKYELVGEVIGGICELIVQYDQAALEATLGVEGYAALPANVRAAATIVLEIEIGPPTTPADIETGGIFGGGGGGFD